MTTPLLIIGLLLLIGAGIGMTLRSVYRPAPARESEVLLAEIQDPACSALELYQPLGRLFAEQDFAFLSRLWPGMVKRLRRSRRQAFRLYLAEAQTAFQGVYTLCRDLAARNPDPTFAPFLTQQFFTFHFLLLGLRLRCALGWFRHVPSDAAELVQALEQLRRIAQAALSVSQPQPAMPVKLA